MLHLTWDEIQKKFPNEHVLIVNPQCPEEYPTQLESGDVAGHATDLDDLLKRCDLSQYDR